MRQKLILHYMFCISQHVYFSFICPASTCLFFINYIALLFFFCSNGVALAFLEKSDAMWPSGELFKNK